MKIYDCFMYNNEELILDLRLNYLDKYVEKFIIAESKYDHQGNLKKNFFKIENFFKFKKKIIHLYIDEFPNNISNWERESYQRNFILNALEDLSNEDFIMISDVDEIPNMENLNHISKYKYTAFKQKNFCYKFNLINKTFPDWYGTKICKKKYLKSPQWLRKQKVKKFSLIRFYKINWNIINNGGWHFSYLMDPISIRNKIMSFGHSEYNKKEFIDLNKIEEKIKNKQDLFGRQQFFKKIEVDNSFPFTIFENQPKYRDWII